VDAASGAASGADGAEGSLAEQLQRYRAQFAATEKATIDLLWDDLGFFHTCRGRPTIFTSALAGDWIARFAGLSPVVAYERAHAHSRKQYEVLVEAYRVMRTRRGASRPLVYREADADGREVPANHKGARLRYVNNPWQSAAYQGLEAIYLDRVDEGLSLIKRVWDKGWHEGYPWDMDHWGIRGHCYMTHPILWLWDADHYGRQGHIYMTHPALWGVFNALTGVAYNAFARRLTVSPRRVPEAGGVRGAKAGAVSEGTRGSGDAETDTVAGRTEARASPFRVPVFLPHFWLQVEVIGAGATGAGASGAGATGAGVSGTGTSGAGTTGTRPAGAPGTTRLRFTVLKSFGEAKLVETVRYLEPDGSGRDVHLDDAVELRSGVGFDVEV
jgi:hypothetical protein